MNKQKSNLFLFMTDPLHKRSLGYKIVINFLTYFQKLNATTYLKLD